MFNNFAEQKEIKVNNETIEKVTKYTYLGQEIWPDGNQIEEIKRRAQAGWASFSRH